VRNADVAEQSSIDESYDGLANLPNKGNVQVGPLGKVSVKKSGKVVYETDFNNKNPRDMVLPDAARRWDIPLENINSIGKYTISATFTYGQKNQTTEVIKTFWVVPKYAIIITAVILIGIVVAVLMAVKFISKRRRGKSHFRTNNGLRRR
jgi:hypothetical protein